MDLSHVKYYLLSINTIYSKNSWRKKKKEDKPIFVALIQPSLIFV